MFRPPRSSSPAKPSDLSRSSAISAVPELTGLTPEDVQLIDAIIDEAGPTVSTFLPVFKVYSDVLSKRGLDPRETNYYGKLIKLGTLKGSNWGEKWRMVKMQNGYDVDPPKSTKALGKMKLTRPPPLSPLTNDLLSSTTSNHVDSEIDYDDTITRPINVLRRRAPSPSDLTSNTLGLDLGDHPILSAPTSSPMIRPYYSNRRFDAEPSEPTAASSSPSLPSYRAAAQDRRIPRTPISHTRFQPTVAASSSKSVSTPSHDPPTRGSAINEEEAWKKVKMLQDEKEADRFRQERLLERCWDVWKQGYKWIITIDQQVADARDNMILHMVLQRWCRRTAEKQAFYKRVDDIANNRILLKCYNKWKLRIKEKYQTKWRHDMRVKIHIVRRNHTEKLRKDAWAKWRQLYQSRLADQRYSEQLVIRFFLHWKRRLVQLDESRAVADQASHGRISRVAEDAWDHWKHVTDLRSRERAITERVSLRIMGETLSVFRKRMEQIYRAEAFYNFSVAKRAFVIWKAARDRIRALERRADKHINREDHVLLQAVMRVWKARERGTLLKTVKASRLLKGHWAIWKARLEENRRLENIAIQYSQQPHSSVAVNAFTVWSRAYASHLNSGLFADQYYASRLVHRQIRHWCQLFLKQNALIEKARQIHDSHTLRRAWDLMRARYGQRIRAAKLREIEREKLRKVFSFWVQRAQQGIHRRFAEQTIADRVRKRILRTTLTHWTNRVIDLKVRELEVAQHHEMQTLVAAFSKWKRIRLRHTEELGLMESYQEVRRQEHVRRLFHHWLSAARMSRNRRITLAAREEEMKFATIAVAWDRWRERFKDERLRPLEHISTVQNKEALKYRAWMTWKSKTKSLPAVNFHSKHLRARYWKIWLNALPRALQAKQAREMDQQSLLKKCLDKWAQAHRTKLALKAVARARYFPVPTSTGPHRPVTSTRPFPAVLSSAPRSRFGQRAKRTPSSDEEEHSSPGPSEPRSKPLGVRPGLFPSRARSEVSPTRTLFSPPKSRDPSPARSTKSSVPAPWYIRERSPVRVPPPPSSAGGEGRSRLWYELREVRQKSKTPSERSQPPREPP
ncbi:hypothetical protein D9758_003196 [Tetrapyrgos nigripes]|uniref:Sfi1 spindle body domain-containing protein n=1 Tax=Tetrapyrgos nigripes TaxID=182062 RepID=A0A8H5GIN4_9AGAR|nr:hypothetical protein D9758_003196 [Tetrapyrgos nigripes]